MINGYRGINILATDLINVKNEHSRCDSYKDNRANEE